VCDTNLNWVDQVTMAIRSPFGRVKVGTLLGWAVFGVFLLATDWMLGRFTHNRTKMVLKELSTAKAHLRQLQEETKQLNARRNDMDLSGELGIQARAIACSLPL
jgi:hypothetical protein